MLSRLIGLKSVSCCCELAVQLCSASQLDSTLSGHHTFVALLGEWGTLCQCPSFCPLFVSHVWWEAHSMAVFLCPFYLTKHSGRPKCARFSGSQDEMERANPEHLRCFLTISDATNGLHEANQMHHIPMNFVSKDFSNFNGVFGSFSGSRVVSAGNLRGECALFWS